MKVSVYIEENIQQINLVPENKYEKDILNSIKERPNEVEFKSGSFSQCRAGNVMFYDAPETNDATFMMVIKPKQEGVSE